MRASETLGDALRGLEAHLNVQNRGAVVHLEIENGVVVVSLALYEPMAEGAGSIYSEGILKGAELFSAYHLHRCHGSELGGFLL